MNNFFQKIIDDVKTSIKQSHNGNGNNISGDKIVNGNNINGQFDVDSIITANGIIEEKFINIKSFDSIINFSSIPILIKQGIKTEIKIIGSSNLLNLINLESDNQLLNVKMSNCSISNSDLKIEIIVPQLIFLELNSLGSMKIEKFNFNQLNVKLNSIASLKLKNCSIRKFDIELNSIGKFSGINTEISNTVNVNSHSTGGFVLIGSETIPEADCLSTGIGNITIDQPILNANVIGTSIGIINLEVKESIKGSCSGIGNIVILGNPRIKEYKNTGIGKFKFK